MNTICGFWSPQKGLKMYKLGKNLFVFQLSSHKDKQKILENQPWHFNRILLVLKEINRDKQLSTIKLSYTLFWVGAYNIPLNNKNNEIVVILGNEVARSRNTKSHWIYFKYERLSTLSYSYGRFMKNCEISSNDNKESEIGL